MPAAAHTEKHFQSSELVRDIVIGMSDGLTVPFALAAGLTGAQVTTHVIVAAGLAEIAAGSIAMGLGGYLAGKTDIEHYASEEAKEYHEVETIPEQEAKEVAEIFYGYGLSKEEAAPVVNALRNNKKQWVDFMMRYELGLEMPDPNRARQSALAIGLSYIAGGLIPLSPYIVLDNLHTSLTYSVAFTGVALIAFGMVKAKFTGISPLKGGLQTVLIGGLAASAAYGLARLFS